MPFVGMPVWCRGNVPCKGVVVFDTSLLDQAWTEQKSRWEQERQLVLQRLRHWLDAYGRQYGLEQVYQGNIAVRFLFGTCPTGMRATSFID